jgi:DNA polymerase I
VHTYLLDASLYIFRAYHSLDPDWHDREGSPTHAVHGFTNTLLTLLERQAPQAIAVCFDEAFDHSFRNELYPRYKSNREPPTEELVKQFAYCKRVAAALGLCVLANHRYEADDLIGSLAAKLKVAGHKTTILSVDKDLGQLLHELAEQWDFTKGQAYGPQGVFEKFGVLPERMAELQALTGDSVDNIPGVAGVGPKTAAALLCHFGSLDNLLARLDEVPYLRVRGAAQLYPKLKASVAQIALARQLTTIACDAPVPELAELQVQAASAEAIDAIFDEVGFGNFLRNRAKNWQRRTAREKGAPGPSS